MSKVCHGRRILPCDDGSHPRLRHFARTHGPQHADQSGAQPSGRPLPSWQNVGVHCTLAQLFLQVFFGSAPQTIGVVEQAHASKSGQHVFDVLQSGAQLQPPSIPPLWPQAFLHVLFGSAPQVVVPQLAIGVWTQPLVLSQESVVHALPSSQFSATCWQPGPGTQESVVHALLSVQLSGAPPWQMPFLHASLTVQTLLSSQVVPGMKTQPAAVHDPLAQGVPALHVWPWEANPLPFARHGKNAPATQVPVPLVHASGWHAWSLPHHLPASQSASITHSTHKPWALSHTNVQSLLDVQVCSTTHAFATHTWAPLQSALVLQSTHAPLATSQTWFVLLQATSDLHGAFPLSGAASALASSTASG